MITQPRVACVVLNWNAYEDTAQCLNSLLSTDYDNLEIIVVDNGSTDDSGKKLAESFPQASVIQNDENLGFAGGMNTGISRALENESKYIIISNNDILMENAESINNLVSVLENDDRIGIITPEIREWPDCDSVWFRQGYVDKRSGNASHIDTHRSFPNLRLKPNIYHSDKSDTLLSNDYVPLCFALVRSQAFREVGLLAEHYFMYYEDIEFAQRVQNQGYEVLTDTTTKVYHRVSGSSGGNQSPLAVYYSARNRLRYIHDNSEYGIVAYLIYFWWATIKTIHSTVVRQNKNLKAFLLGVYDGVRGKTGKGRYP